MPTPTEQDRNDAAQAVIDAAREVIEREMLTKSHPYTEYQRGMQGGLIVACSILEPALDAIDAAQGQAPSQPEPCATCGDPPKGEECSGCEGAARWRGSPEDFIITCGKCMGTGRRDLRGPKKPPLVISLGRREPCPDCEPARDVERLAAEFHAIYQAEARRQGDVRHPDDYATLPERVKDFDRVLARHALRLVSDAEARQRETCATVAETWADSQDRVALLKLGDDCPASAESHEASAIIARRIAMIQRGRATAGS